ncbi:NADPH-dependent FMN reductase [Luteimonas notoginsengisoli]|uniref:NADPH-dependent FMN reductase n=1 Tax=Luteimonas notoginsengisoli TaxID=1578200 RepID=A0ABV7UU08_9GAMM
MANIVGLCGSLRRGSFNAALLRAAAALAPDGSRIDAHTLHGVPLYDGDVEAAEGILPVVATMKDAVAAADGLLLVTPEYNNGIPGVFKNAIDWMSRPGSDIARVFGGKPVTVIGASPGSFGTQLAQNAWLPVLRTLGTAPWCEGRLMVARAGQVFDDEGRIVDAGIEGRLRDFVARFCAHVDDAGMRPGGRESKR